jgi:hypothetical protein
VEVIADAAASLRPAGPPPFASEGNMETRLIHDAAFATAKALLEMIAPLLREEERRDAFEALYEAVKAGIEAYAVQSHRQRQRLSRN